MILTCWAAIGPCCRSRFLLSCYSLRGAHHRWFCNMFRQICVQMQELLNLFIVQSRHVENPIKSKLERFLCVSSSFWLELFKNPRWVRFYGGDFISFRTKVWPNVYWVLSNFCEVENLAFYKKKMKIGFQN
jgi:hypothetical protein